MSELVSYAGTVVMGFFAIRDSGTPYKTLAESEASFVWCPRNPSDSGMRLWRSRTGVRVPLLAGLTITVEYETDYDSQPAVEALTTDRTINFKLG